MIVQAVTLLGYVGAALGGLAGIHFLLKSAAVEKVPTSVALFDQGPVQVLQIYVTGLEPKRPLVLALSHRPDGSGELEPLEGFTTNSAEGAIVNAVGPIRQIVQGEDNIMDRRYLMIAPGTPEQHVSPVQIQAP